MNEEIDYNDLIFRFFEKKISDAELSKLTQWINASDNNRKIFDEFNETYQLADIQNKHWLYDTETNWEKIKQRIQKEDEHSKTKVITKKRYLWLQSAAVASVLLVLATFAWKYQNQVISDDYHSDVRVVAPLGQKSQVFLEDGSTVWLNSGSELTYTYDSKLKRRLVKMQGEAFFEVAEDKKRPFIVSTGEIELKVYGTRFNVHAYKDDAFIETTLEEGSVGVNIPSSGEEWIMVPGQQCIFNKHHKTIDIKDTSVNFYSSWKENKLIFDESTFADVAITLERWYGVTIELEEDFDESEALTLTVTHESLTEILELIKVVAPIQYEINERHVKITKSK